MATNFGKVDFNTQFSVLRSKLDSFANKYTSNDLLKSWAILDQLKHWEDTDFPGILEKTDLYMVEEGPCFAWPFTHSFCEVCDDAIELYIGEGSGEKIGNYHTKCFSFDNEQTFYSELKSLFKKFQQNL